MSTTNEGDGRPEEGPVAATGRFLSEVKEAQHMLQICNRASGEGRKALLRVQCILSDARFLPVLDQLEKEDRDEEYTIKRARACVTYGFRLFNSNSGHSFGWVEEGLRVLEARLSPDKLSPDSSK